MRESSTCSGRSMQKESRRYRKAAAPSRPRKETGSSSRRPPPLQAQKVAEQNLYTAAVVQQKYESRTA